VTVRLMNKTVLHCTCVHCAYEWDTFEMPKRCAGCRRHSWNGEDKRRSDPQEFVPPGSQIEGKIPELRNKELRETLMLVRAILGQIVSDYGPCEHAPDAQAKPGQACVCHETGVLARVNKQIELLDRLASPSELRRQWRPRLARA
jgi:hypothetical protein